MSAIFSLRNPKRFIGSEAEVIIFAFILSDSVGSKSKEVSFLPFLDNWILVPSAITKVPLSSSWISKLYSVLLFTPVIFILFGSPSIVVLVTKIAIRRVLQNQRR